MLANAAPLEPTIDATLRGRSRLRLATGALVALACGLAPPTWAQSARDATRLDQSTLVSAGDPNAASEGELSLVVFRSDDQVVASRSEDRGLTWSAPVRIDTDTSGSAKWVTAEGDGSALQLEGGVAHVVWRDARLGADDLWYANSADGGRTWSPEQRLDKGYPAGTAPVREYALAATRSGGQTHLHVLFTVDPGAGGAFLPDELHLLRSTDGGTSWTAAQGVSSANGTGADVDSFALHSEGSTLLLAWSDDRFGASTLDDLWLLRSLDGGSTFVGPETQIDPSGPLNGDVENELALAVEGDLVVLGWEEEFGSVREEAWVAVSGDGGQSFTSARRVGAYAPATTDVDDVAVAVQGGTVFAGWDDDRSGTDGIRIVHSSDLGLSWSSEASLSDEGGDLRLVAGADVLVAAWSGDPIGGGGDRARATTTRDGGLTWGPTRELSSNSGDVDAVRPVWNATYGNVIAPWLADDPGTNGVWVGGFRPQELLPVNWTSGGAARIDFVDFDDSATWVWALGSASTGSLRLGFGDGRDLGLAFDPVLSLTLQSPNLFSAPLDAAGTGSSPTFVLADSPGTVYHLAAISLRLAPIELVELTDTVRVVIQ